MKGKRGWNVASRLKSNLARAERMGGIVGSSSDTAPSATNRDASFAGMQRERILTIERGPKTGRETKTSRYAKKSNALRCSRKSLALPKDCARCWRKCRKWLPLILQS